MIYSILPSMRPVDHIGYTSSYICVFLCMRLSITGDIHRELFQTHMIDLVPSVLIKSVAMVQRI